jgi:hypothetical protein
MRKALSSLMLILALFVLGTAATSAAMTKATAQLRPPAGTHMMDMAHAMGSATITYTAHDATIKVTTDGLPAPARLHENAYVLWLVTGSKGVYGGTLKVTGNMAGVHAMVMDTTFTKLVISAEKSMHPMHRMGPKVLVGSVMHH